MSLSFCVLGSGSGGNCTLLQLRHRLQREYLLIDAGLSPRETARRLGPLGVNVAQIRNIILTHLDYDHLHLGWLKIGQRLGITFHVHRHHLARPGLIRLPLGRTEPFDDLFPLNGATVEPILLPHDQLGATGFVIEHRGARLGYATDLGRVTPTFTKRFVNLTAIALESNYDPPMQAASDRPEVLKRRIMCGLGHLSNEQALEAVLAIARRDRLAHVVLLHLSRQCNDPRLVQRLYARRAPELLDRLTITNQHEPTPMLDLGRTAATPAPLAGGQLNLWERSGVVSGG